MFKKIVFYVLAIYTVLGFVALPLIVKPQLISLVEKETNAKLQIDSIFFNPYAFYLNVSGLKLIDKDDKELAYIKETHINLEPFSLIKSAVHVKNFILEEPKISLVLDADKKINFASIAKEKAQEEEVQDANSTTKLPRIILDRIAIINGSVLYDDYSQGKKFSLNLDTLGLELKNIDTNDLNASDAKIRFYTLLSDGGFIDFRSEIVGFEPLIVQGSLGFEASKLYTQWRYVQDMLNLEVADGKLSFDGKYNINFDNLEDMSITDLNLHLDNLRIKPKGNHKDILNLKSLLVEDVSVKPLAQKVHLKKIALNSLEVSALRDAQGEIDWLSYIKINNQDSNTTQTQEDNVTVEVKPWDVTLDSLALEKIKVNFDDKGVKPSLKHTLENLNIFAQNITLDGAKPLSYQMDLFLNNALQCNFKGEVVHKVLDASSQARCRDLDVTYYLPYIDEVARDQLDVYNVELRSLIAGFDANVSVKDVNSSIVIEVGEGNIHLDTFALNKRSTNKRLVTFSDFDIMGIALNTATKDLSISETTLKALNVRTKRLKDGTLSVENLVVPKKVKEVKNSQKTKDSKEEKEYSVKLAKVSLEGAKIGFEDQMLTPSVHSKIDGIYLTAKNIDSKKYSWMNYYLSARVNSKGKIKSSGTIRHTPLKQKGSLELNKIALKDINPYLEEHAYVYLADGQINLKTKTSYAASSTKADLSLDGSFGIKNLFVNDTRDDSTLLSFEDLNLKNFTLETEPNRLFINEVDVNSFYVNALIDANKTMNFATLTKGSGENNESQDTNVTQESIVVADLNTTQEQQKDPFPVKIMKVNVKNGSAVFADASLPIDFKTNIHDLNGVIYAISTNKDETTYIDIDGEVDKYGSTKLKGSINAFNPKAYTDINFNFKNLDLSAMSGYSATFAGYKIANGKLFLDLNYDIKESELAGENSIIIKKMELGDELKVEGGSSLPLGFVIALLEDSEGVIDIDMPVRGNVDEPDFKYGALVWKTLGNLILKAVASPFSFLGSMLGIDGDSLKYAEFEAGSFMIVPSEREKLDNVAKLLLKRPKMNLNITGTYDSKADKEAIQKRKLADLVVKRSGAKNEQERITAMNIDLLEDIYEDAKNDDKIDKIRKELKKIHDDKEKFKRAYLQALVKECSAIQIVTPEELQVLARQRGEAIRTYLTTIKELSSERIKELPIVEATADEKAYIQTKLEVSVK